jgi:hypothetical protein
MDPATIRIDERFNPEEAETGRHFRKEPLRGQRFLPFLVLTVIALGLPHAQVGS